MFPWSYRNHDGITLGLPRLLPVKQLALCRNMPLDRATIKEAIQDLLLDLVIQRCKLPLRALWIERDTEGGGTVLRDHFGKTPRSSEYITANEFPECLLSEDWSSMQSRRQVLDDLKWQAPMLSMLPLATARRRGLESIIQQNSGGGGHALVQLTASKLAIRNDVPGIIAKTWRICIYRQLTGNPRE